MARPKCRLDENHCVSLKEILESFNAPISEEQAWALCYQCAKCAKNALRTDPDHCRVVTRLDQVLIHRDGHVHPHTLLAPPGHPGSSKDLIPTEQNIVNRLGLILFHALDFGFDKDEERPLSPELTNLILRITRKGEGGVPGEADDEGIERDSGECDDDGPSSASSLSHVIQECVSQLGGSQEADSHYRAVCRALVAEALELASFLESVKGGPQELSSQLASNPPSADLEALNFADWARLWVQVIRELRRGVQLKKVCYTRKPIEYELTPYEILMEDIRARKYKLNKVSQDASRFTQSVKKDAHALILEYIRSRPPLRKASERKLPPKKSLSLTPREMLLESIKKGHAKLRSPRDEGSLGPCRPLEKDKTRSSTRRLIKIDYSFIPDDEEEEEGEEAKTEEGGNRGNNPWQRTGSSRLSQSEIHQYCDSTLQSYDLATQCPPSRRSMRRHTVVVCEPSNKGSLSVPQSRAPTRPSSRQAETPPSEDSLGSTIPEMSWSRNSLQEDLLQSKQWQEECLSLTLEEIVHIRSVLTKAELESLPVEGQVKEDAEKRKVCFLCMKTRFGIFGPWGQICKLCERTVCAKCYSKMRIPTEHFSHVPVVALSPSVLSPTEEDSSFPRALVTRLMETRSGSAPASPKMNRSAPPSNMSTSLISDDGSYPMSLPPSSPILSTPEKWRLARDRATGRQKEKAEKLKGLQMTVCLDCKAMVLQIIKSSRVTRNNAIRNLTLDLSPVY